MTRIGPFQQYQCRISRHSKPDKFGHPCNPSSIVRVISTPVPSPEAPPLVARIASTSGGRPGEGSVCPGAQAQGVPAFV